MTKWIHSDHPGDSKELLVTASNVSKFGVGGSYWST